MVDLFFYIRNLIKQYPSTKLILYPVYRTIGVLYSSQIPLDSEFIDKPKFMHGLYGIFVAGKARIGNNVTFYHHVTIGGVNNKESKNYGAPIIGDNCILYPGSKILGNVKIGNNCQIGPNVVIWFDVPDDSTVLFDKQSLRIIGKKNA